MKGSILGEPLKLRMLQCWEYSDVEDALILVVSNVVKAKSIGYLKRSKDFGSG